MFTFEMLIIRLTSVFSGCIQIRMVERLSWPSWAWISHLKDTQRWERERNVVMKTDWSGGRVPLGSSPQHLSWFKGSVHPNYSQKNHINIWCYTVKSVAQLTIFATQEVARCESWMWLFCRRFPSITQTKMWESFKEAFTEFKKRQTNPCLLDCERNNSTQPVEHSKTRGSKW